MDPARRRVLFGEVLLGAPGPYSYIRAINLDTGALTVVGGWGSIGYSGPAAEGSSATATSLGVVAGIAVNGTSDEIYFAEPSIRRVRRISGGKIFTVGGTGADGCPTPGQLATAAPMSSPQTLLIDGATGHLLVLLGDGCNQVVRIASNGMVQAVTAGRASAATGTFDGDLGLAAVAGLSSPGGLAAAMDAATGSLALFIAETGSHVLRAVNRADGTIRTAAGLGGAPGYAGDGSADVSGIRFDQPKDIAAAQDGSVLLADAGNFVIRARLPNGTVTLLAGQPRVGGDPAASADHVDPTSMAIGPARVAYDASAQTLYFVDSRASAVRALRCVPTTSSIGMQFLVTAGNWTGCPVVSAFSWLPGATRCSLLTTVQLTIACI